MTKVKVMHIADIHLGMENYGKIDKTSGLHSRLKDFIDTFDQAVEYAIKNNLDLVVFAGDAFKNRDPNPTQQREFAKRIKRLSNNGIQIVLLVGNHDLPSSDSRAHSLEIYNTLEVEGVHVVKKPSLLRINTTNGAVQVVAIPYAAKSLLLTRDEYKDYSLEQINNLIGEKITQTISVLAKDLNSHIPSILTAHLSVANAKVGSERSIMLGNELVLPISSLALPQFDYIALGHIHKHQILKQEHPPVVYSGSLDRIDFNEESDSKGFVLVELEKGHTHYKFMPLKVRPFKTLHYKISINDDTESLMLKIDKENIEDAIVRIVLELTPEDLGRLNLKDIIKTVENRAYYLAGITKKWLKEDANLRNPELTEGVLPLEALKKYLEDKSSSNLEKKELLKRAELLLKELKEEERGEELDTHTTKA